MSAVYKIPYVLVEKFDGPSAVFPNSAYSATSGIPYNDANGPFARQNVSWGDTFVQRNWHWRATLPTFNVGIQSIVLINSVVMQSMPGTTTGTAELTLEPDWDCRYSIDGGPHYQFDTFQTVTGFGTYLDYVDPYQEAMYDYQHGGFPGQLRSLVSPKLYTPTRYVHADHDNRWGLGGGYFWGPAQGYDDPPFNTGETGLAPKVQNPVERIVLRQGLIDGSETVFRSFEFWESGWESVLELPPGCYRPRPFPTVVDFWFSGVTAVEGWDIPGPQEGISIPNAWVVTDHTLYVLAFGPEIIDGKIASGPGSDATVRSIPVHGHRS